MNSPRVLLIAGVHGDEYEPIVALTQLARELDGRLIRGSVEIEPLANPAAFNAKSRFGEDGLDMARVCPGNEKGSPTEQAAYALSQKIRQADMLVDFHTGGVGFDIYPLVGYMLHPDLKIRDKQREIAEATGMPLIWGTDHLPEGRTLSIARDAGVPSIYLEYGGGAGFRPHVVEEYKRVVKRVLVKLGMIEGDPVDSPPWRFWLEDDRLNSGFLQGKMPAQHSGIFVPNVKVGDWINEGEDFGTIVNPKTSVTQHVFAADSGVVFLLRLTTAVEVGDALGGIMPVTEYKKIVIDDGKSSHY